MMTLIVGKSASGKDFLARELTQRGLKQVISRTDRPRRVPDEDTHVFVSPETATEESKRAIAKTAIAGHVYYTLPEDLANRDVYVIDPKGVGDICRHMPDTVFQVIYVDADDATRKAHACARAEDPDLAARVFDERDAFEDETRPTNPNQTYVNLYE